MELRERLRRCAVRLQRTVADWLSRAAERLSVRVKKLVLFVFGTLMAGYFIALILGVVTYDFNRPLEVRMPLVATQGDTVTDSEARQWIKQYKQMMDSLELTPFGRETKMRIEQRHPGFADTLYQLERILNKKVYKNGKKSE